MSEFSERAYFDKYKAIRNRFRKFDSKPLVLTLLQFLPRPTKNEVDRLQRQPWVLLLLIKWILIDEQNGQKGRRLATEADAINLLNSVIDLAGKARLPSHYEHITLFFRALAYQQFIYQEEFELVNFARQYSLFLDLPEAHFIKTNFKSLIGLSIQTFLTMSVVLLVRFLAQGENTIAAQFFSPIASAYGSEAVSRFLNSFAKDLDEMTAYMNLRNDGTRPAAEYFEQSPFLNYPLIKERWSYLCTDRHLLFQCIEHFIYDRMRQWDAQRFMNEFGQVFEKYVETVIQHAGLPYVNETQVLQIIGEKGKVIDFIISDGSANIFIDAKAVEMAYQGKVAHLGEIVESRTGAIIKAIQQAQETVGRLSQSKNSHPFIRGASQNYLIVVTFKELYLGNGKTMYEGIAKATLDAIYAKCAGSPTIPLDNIYFLNIADFEMLSELVHERKLTFAEALEKAKIDDATPQTRKFGFRLHLTDWNLNPDTPKYLKSRFDNEIENLKSLLSSTS